MGGKACWRLLRVEAVWVCPNPECGRDVLEMGVGAGVPGPPGRCPYCGFVEGAEEMGERRERVERDLYAAEEELQCGGLALQQRLDVLWDMFEAEKAEAKKREGGV